MKISNEDISIVWSEVRNQPWLEVNNQLITQIDYVVKDRVNHQVINQVWEPVWIECYNQVNNQVYDYIKK